MGAISVSLKGEYGADSLRYAAMIAVGFYLVAAVLALLSVKSLRRGWVEQAGYRSRVAANFTLG